MHIYKNKTSESKLYSIYNWYKVWIFCETQFQLYVCISDLTEQKAEVMERKLSVLPRQIDGGTTPAELQRHRASSILAKCEPKSVATVQSSMASERLSYIALFEGCTGVTMSIGIMAMGKQVLYKKLILWS